MISEYGSNHEVVLRMREGEEYVVKEFAGANLNEDNRRQLEREVANVKRIDSHPSIPLRSVYYGQLATYRHFYSFLYGKKFLFLTVF